MVDCRPPGPHMRIHLSKEFDCRVLMEIGTRNHRAIYCKGDRLRVWPSERVPSYQYIMADSAQRQWLHSPITNCQHPLSNTYEQVVAETETVSVGKVVAGCVHGLSVCHHSTPFFTYMSLLAMHHALHLCCTHFSACAALGGVQL